MLGHRLIEFVFAPVILIVHLIQTIVYVKISFYLLHLISKLTFNRHCNRGESFQPYACFEPSANGGPNHAVLRFPP
jgi:hypothetical protein